MIEISEYCRECGSPNLLEDDVETNIIPSFDYDLPDDVEITSLTERCQDCGYVCTKSKYEPDPDTQPGGHDYKKDLSL